VHVVVRDSRRLQLFHKKIAGLKRLALDELRYGTTERNNNVEREYEKTTLTV
jgi:hypothetical protein